MFVHYLYRDSVSGISVDTLRRNQDFLGEVNTIDINVAPL